MTNSSSKDSSDNTERDVKNNTVQQAILNKSQKNIYLILLEPTKTQQTATFRYVLMPVCKFHSAVLITSQILVSISSPLVWCLRFF